MRRSREKRSTVWSSKGNTKRYLHANSGPMKLREALQVDGQVILSDMKEFSSVEEVANALQTGFRVKCRLFKIVPHPQIMQSLSSIVRMTFDGSGSGEEKHRNAAEESRRRGDKRSEHEAETRARVLHSKLCRMSVAVCGWELDIGTAAALSLFLPQFSQLQTIKFWNASLSAETLHMLASTVVRGTHIRRVYVEYNAKTLHKRSKDGRQDIDEQIREALEMLVGNDQSPVQLLAVGNNALRDCHIGGLCGQLAGNKVLVVLDCHSNALSNESALLIADALVHNRTLKCLELSGNDVSDNGVVAISTALIPRLLEKSEAKKLKGKVPIVTIAGKPHRAANEELAHLCLEGNPIADAGIAALQQVQQYHDQNEVQSGAEHSTLSLLF